MIFKPSNCYPQVSEIDLSKANTFSCVNNTGGESTIAYKLSILDKDGENTIYEPNEPISFETPVKNKGLVSIEDIKSDIVTKVPAGISYYERTGEIGSYVYTKVPDKVLEESVTFGTPNSDGYSAISYKQSTYYVKAPIYYGNSFANEKDYQWNIRLYNQAPGATTQPNTVVCQGYIVGSTKSVVWLRLPNHGEGEANYDIANQILYDRYIELTATSASQLVLGAHDDDDKTFPTFPYTERQKIDWVEKQLGTDKDIIKIETVDPFEYNFIDGTEFKIYQCSSEHTVKSLFADPNSNINVSQYTLVYQDLAKAQASRDAGDLPESISLATMSDRLAPCMKKVGGEDYAARKITGYSSDTGEMRFNDSFSVAPNNGEYYRLFTYNSSTKKYEPVDDAVCKETHNFSAGSTTTVALNQTTFLNMSQGEGSYIFTYNSSSKWKLSDGVLTVTPTLPTGVTVTTDRFVFIKKLPTIQSYTFTCAEDLSWTLTYPSASPTTTITNVNLEDYGLTLNIPEGTVLVSGNTIVAVIADSDITLANYGLTVTLPSGKSLAADDRITVNVQSDPLIRHRVGGSPITSTYFTVMSNKWSGSDKRLFIQPNINIKTDPTNPNEIVFTSNACRVDINKQTTTNATTGKLLDITFNKLDDTQWLLEGDAISYYIDNLNVSSTFSQGGSVTVNREKFITQTEQKYATYKFTATSESEDLVWKLQVDSASYSTTVELADYGISITLTAALTAGDQIIVIPSPSSSMCIPKDSNNNIIPQSDYTIYSDFADASPYNVFYARKEPTLTLQIRNEYSYNHKTSLSAYNNYKTLRDYHLKDPDTGAWYIMYDTLESYLRKGCVYDTDFIQNKSIYIRTDSSRKDVDINRYNFVTGTSHSDYTFWNQGTYTFLYKSSKWYYDNNEINIANYGLTITGSEALEDGQYFIVVNTLLDKDFKTETNYTPTTETWTYTCDNNKVIHGPVVNNTVGKYVLTKSTTGETSIWTYEGTIIDLAENGITISSQPPNGTTITITVSSIDEKRYYAAWSLKDTEGEDVTELESVVIFKEKVQNGASKPPELGLYLLKYNGTNWDCSLESTPSTIITTDNLLAFGLKLYDTFDPSKTFTPQLNDKIYIHLGVYTCSNDVTYETRSSVYRGTIAEFNGQLIPYAAIYMVNKYYYATSPAYDYREVGFNTVVSYDSSAHPQIKYYKYTLSSTTFVTKTTTTGTETVEVDTYISSSDEIYSSDIEWSFRALEGGEKYQPNLYRIDVAITDEYGAIYETGKVFAIYYDSATSVIPLVLDYDCHEQSVVINARNPLNVISTDEDDYQTVTTDNIDNDDFYVSIPSGYILNYDSVDKETETTDLILPEELTWLTQFRINSGFLSSMKVGEIKTIATLTHEYMGVSYSTEFAERTLTMTVNRLTFANKVGETPGEYSFKYEDGYWRLYSILYQMADERILEVISRNNLITNRSLVIPSIAGAYNNRTLILEESGTKQELADLGVTLSDESLVTSGDKFSVVLTTSESFDLTLSYPAGYYIDETATEDEERIKSIDYPASLQLYTSTDTNREFPIECFSIDNSKKEYYSLIDNCGSKYGFQTSLKYVLQNPSGYIIKTEDDIGEIPTLEPTDFTKKYIFTFSGRIRSTVTDQILSAGVWTYDEQSGWLLDRQTMYTYVQNEMELPLVGYRQMTYADIAAPEGTYSQPDYHYTVEQFGTYTTQDIYFEQGEQGQDLFLIAVNGVTGTYRFAYATKTKTWTIDSTVVYTNGTIPAGIKYYSDKELTEEKGTTTEVTNYYTEEISETTYYYINITEGSSTVKRYFSKPTYSWFEGYHIGIPFDFVPEDGSALNVYVGRDFLYVSSHNGTNYIWVDSPASEITETVYDNLWITLYGVIKTEDTVSSKALDDRITCYIKWSEDGKL